MKITTIFLVHATLLVGCIALPIAASQRAIKPSEASAKEQEAAKDSLVNKPGWTPDQEALREAWRKLHILLTTHVEKPTWDTWQDPEWTALDTAQRTLEAFKEPNKQLEELYCMAYGELPVAQRKILVRSMQRLVSWIVGNKPFDQYTLTIIQQCIGDLRAVSNNQYVRSLAHLIEATAHKKTTLQEQIVRDEQLAKKLAQEDKDRKFAEQLQREEAKKQSQPAQEEQKKKSDAAYPYLALAKKAVEYSNNFRAKHKLPACQWDDRLAEIALGHSIYMGEKNIFSHVGSDNRFKETHAQSFAENIYMCEGLPGDLARAAVDGWIKSKGHRENMLVKNWTHCGIGTYKNARGETYFTQIFARY